MSIHEIAVIAGLDPAIHQSKACRVIVWMDARVKPAHDEQSCRSQCENLTMSEIA
jgi:hypothetical protein